MMRQARLDRHPLPEHVLEPLGPQAVFDRDGQVREIDGLPSSVRKLAWYAHVMRFLN